MFWKHFLQKILLTILILFHLLPFWFHQSLVWFFFFFTNQFLFRTINFLQVIITSAYLFNAYMRLSWPTKYITTLLEVNIFRRFLLACLKNRSEIDRKKLSMAVGTQFLRLRLDRPKLWWSVRLNFPSNLLILTPSSSDSDRNRSEIHREKLPTMVKA